MFLTVVIFIVILSILVFVHELGHFFTAKKFGMGVEEFGFGFPPRVLKMFSKNGTDYTLNWIPLGGFVKIKGESGENAEDEDSFAHKKIWKRFIVLVAGVSMNMILAWVLLSFGFGIGTPHVIDEAEAVNYPDSKIEVLSVIENSPAAGAGIAIGDQIIGVDGIGVFSIDEFQKYILENSDREITVEVKRSDEYLEYKLKPIFEPEIDRPAIGVGLVRTAVISYPWYESIWQGAKATVFTTARIFSAFGGMIKNLFTSGSLGADVAGPVGIAVMTGQVVNLGFIYVLQFAALLSINLAIINILPFPALDGGRVLFLIIEKIIRRPVNQKLEAIVHNTGFMLLMLLILVVTFRDIGKFSENILNVFKKIIP